MSVDEYIQNLKIYKLQKKDGVFIRLHESMCVIMGVRQSNKPLADYIKKWLVEQIFPMALKFCDDSSSIRMYKC